MNETTLSVIRRHDLNNLFVRLSPRLARQLLVVKKDWTPSTRCESGVEFLPLCIQYEETCVYASYNGGNLTKTSDLKDESNEKLIEVPASLLSTDADIVSVKALSFVETAQDLLVEPMSQKDWLLLNSNSSWLEHGGLLQQVSVVYANQILSLVIQDNVARLRIMPENFQSIWGTLPCLRLVAKTCVIVKPIEQFSTATDKDVSVQAFPSRVDYPYLEELLPIHQCCAWIHPDLLTDRQRAQLERCSVVASITSNGSQVFVSLDVSTLVPSGFVVMHPLTRLQLQIALCCDLVLIKMLSPLEAEQMNATLLNVCQRNVAEVCLERVVVDRQHLLPPWRYPVLFIQSNDDTTGSTSWSGLIESLEDLGDLPITLGVVLQLPRPDDINSYPLTGNFYRLVLQGAEDTRVSLANSFIRAQDAVLLLRQRVHYRHVSIGPSIAHDESLLIPNHSGGEWCVSELLSKLKASRARRSVLISGGTGSGKTLAAMVVASRMQVSFQCNISYLDCRRLKDGRGFQLSRIMLELDTLVGSLVQSSRAILILDDLDDIIPFCGVDVNEKGSEHAQQPNSLMKDQCLAIESTLCKLIRVANECGCQMLFVVTCSDPQCISSQVMSSLAIDSKLNLPLLSSNDRIKLFCSALRQSCASSLVTEMELVGLDKATAGYRPRDFERLALRIKQLSVTDVEESFAAVAREVLNEYVPLSKLSAVTANSKLSYGWNEVGGLFDAKEELIATILRPSKYSRIYENAHIRLPRGVLMFGESGCGKSFLVPAFAAKCGFPLITCRGPELLDKYIGASEAKIRELFSRAASVAPSILFLDELDSLAPRRGYDSTGVTDRIVNQLLTFLDGVEETSISGSVYIIAATSRPDKVDPALLRPGRLERHVYVGLPKDEEEWRDLFINTSRRYDTDDDVIQFVSSSGSFARGQENYTLALSAAELSSVFNTAQVAAAHEALSAESNPSKVFLKLRHIKHAIQTTKPSMSKADGVRLRRIYAAFRKDRAVGDIHKSPDMDTANLLRTALK